jgi:hypothetical protein
MTPLRSDDPDAALPIQVVHRHVRRNFVGVSVNQQL